MTTTSGGQLIAAQLLHVVVVGLAPEPIFIDSLSFQQTRLRPPLAKCSGLSSNITSIVPPQEFPPESSIEFLCHGWTPS